jgi:predicted aspartyl protease
LFGWRLRAAFTGLALLALAACGDAGSADGTCRIEPLARAPIETRANLLFLTAAIDGAPVRLLVDTGAERTTLTEAAVARLGLVRDTRYRTQMRGIGDATNSFDAKTHTLIFGSAQFSGLNMTVGQFASDEIAGQSFDGLLGTDILASFDVEIDPAAGQMTLFRPRPCTDATPPWTPPYITLEATGPPRGRLQIPIQLDSVLGIAVLDTGAQITTVSERLALRAGVTASMLSQDPSGMAKGASPNAVAARAHRFGELRVGPTLVRAPVLAVLPMSGSSAEALIGANFLRGQKIWLSFASRRVFLAPLGVGAKPAS